MFDILFVIQTVAVLTTEISIWAAQVVRTSLWVVTGDGGEASQHLTSPSPYQHNWLQTILSDVIWDFLNPS